MKELLVPKVLEESRRKILFMFEGIILEKVCDFVSWGLLREPGLPTEPHPHPCRVGWIKIRLATRIERVCKIPIVFGRVHASVSLVT